MNRVFHLHPTDLQGLSRLAIDGVAGTTGLVEQLHHTILRISGPIGPAPQGRTRGITGLVYRSIHGVTGLVGGTLNLAFNQIVPHFNARRSSPRREHMLSAINGVLGDHLDESNNPLRIGMSLRRNGESLLLQTDHLRSAFAKASPRLLITVHGLCLNDLRWTPGTASPGRDLPASLANELGYSALHLHYNSGRSIAANGRDFAKLLEALVEQWPVPVEEIVILGHSMGGLVARSACHFGVKAGHGWPQQLRRLIFLGTPHHGAPLERAGHGFERLLGISPYSAPFVRLGNIRSAGITDLRHGKVLDQDCTDPGHLSAARAILPEHVDCHAIAATTAGHADSRTSRLIGDGLVPVDSALGRHPDPARHLPIREADQWIAHSTSHIGLLHHAGVLQVIGRWLR